MQLWTLQCSYLYMFKILFKGTQIVNDYAPWNITQGRITIQQGPYFQSPLLPLVAKPIFHANVNLGMNINTEIETSSLLLYYLLFLIVKSENCSICSWSPPPNNKEASVPLFAMYWPFQAIFSYIIGLFFAFLLKRFIWDMRGIFYSKVYFFILTKNQNVCSSW